MTRLVGLAAAATLTAMMATPAVAQVVIQPAIGVNFANISNGDQAFAEPGVTAESKLRTGFAAGVGVLFSLSEQLRIGTGGYYSQQGIKLTLSDGTTTADAKLELDYIQVPLTLGVGFPTGGAVTPHLFAGPIVGFNATCKLSFSGGSEDCESDTINSTDFGLLFGGGLGFRAGTGMFVVNAYYDLGFTNVEKDAASGSPTFKNRVFGFSVGYGFPLGGGGM